MKREPPKASVARSSRGRLLPRIALLLVLVGVAAELARRGLSDVRRLRALDGVCEATAQGRFAEAVSSSDPLLAALRHPERQNRLLQCRCSALSAQGLEVRCRDEITAVLLGVHSADELVAFDVHVVRTGIDRLLDTQRAEEAWQLVRSWREAQGDDRLMQGREFLARLRLEPEDALLAEFIERLGSGTLPRDVPIMIASQDLRLGRPDRASKILGDRPPRGEGDEVEELRRLWFVNRVLAAAQSGDLAALERTLDAWRDAGLAEGERRARLGLLGSSYALMPTERAQALMRGALELEKQLAEETAIAVRSRLVRVLASRDRLAEALALYDESRRRYDALIGLDREELERLARRQQAVGPLSPLAPQTRSIATVRFAGLEPGDVLWISPSSADSAAAPLERLVARGASLVLERPTSDRPLWWLLRGARGSELARGTAWASAAGETRVEVQRRARAALSSQRTDLPERAPADGRRRVVLLVWDSADWRILRFLEAAREVPVFTELLAASTFGVLRSDPPYTAAALQRLVSPGDHTMGMVELVHQLGEEVESLNFVGRNPVHFLAAVLERESDLFSTLGAAGHPALNLLRAVGSIEGGRNALLVGPRGSEEVTGLLGKRPLSQSEMAAIPGIETDLEEYGEFLGEAAADLDTLRSMIEAGEADFIASRIASLDLMTHATFGELSDAGQHDGELALLRFYRYLDLRLRDIVASLDRDDVLILLSDHGTLSSFEHDTDAVLVLHGPMFAPATRLAQGVDLAGIPRLAAELLGVEVNWPDGGVLGLLDLPALAAAPGAGR